MENKNDKYIGCLWLQKAKSGLVYMSGVIELNGQKQDIVIFKNTRKEKENQPDYQILKSEPYKKEEFIPEEVPVINQDIDDANSTLQVNADA